MPSTTYWPGAGGCGGEAVIGIAGLSPVCAVIARPFTVTRARWTPPVIGTGWRRGVPGAKTFCRRYTGIVRSESGEWFTYTTVSCPETRLRATSSATSMEYRGCWTQ